MKLPLAEYVATLDSEPELLRALLDRVTVQETAFFRDPKQFDVLRDYVLFRTASPVTIWCAGCSNGQEPYSLAMTLEESGIKDWRVIATDISRPALERSRRASYSSRELAGVSALRRERHFLRDGERWELRPTLRARVEVRQHNLVNDSPPFDPGAVELVFCRNVLIYVGPAEVAAFLERLARWMPEGAWLFLGFSESIWQLSDRFQLERIADSFVYRRHEVTAVGPLVASRRHRAPGGGRLSVAELTAGRGVAATTRRRRPDSAAAVQDSAELLAIGAAAADSGNYPEAIRALRRCVYLDPDHVVAQLHLGLAFEASGDAAASRQAFGAARAALERVDSAAVEKSLGGYGLPDLVRLLRTKLAPEADPRGRP